MAAMFAVVSFSACSDDDDKINPDQIVGEWQLTRSVGYMIDLGERYDYDKNYPDKDGAYPVYVFKADGTGISYWFYPSADADYGDPFTYSVSGTELIITYHYETPEISHMEIKKLTSADLILYENNIEAEFVDTSTYKKIK